MAARNRIPGILAEGFAVLVVSLAGAYAAMGAYGVHDYVDYNSYMACALAFATQGAEPVIPGTLESLAAPSEPVRYSGYPNKLFQLVLGLYAVHVAPDRQPSTMALLSCFVLLLANGALYWFMRRLSGAAASTLALAVLNLAWPFRLYGLTMVRPLSDCFLMLTVALAALLAMGRGIVSAAPAMGLGFLFRAQAVQVLPFVPLLDKRSTWRKVLAYLAMAGCVVVLENRLFGLFLQLTPKGSSIEFYINAFFRDTSPGLIKGALGLTVSLVLKEPMLHGLTALAAFLSLGLLSRRLEDSTRRVARFSLCVAGMAFLGWVVMSMSSPEGQAPRYFVYSMPFALMAAVLMMRDVARGFPFLAGRGAHRAASCAAWAVAAGLVLYTAQAFVPADVARKFHQSDLVCRDGRLDIPPGSVVGCVSQSEAFRISTILGAQAVLLPESFEAFLRGAANGKLDYLFVPEQYGFYTGYAGWAAAGQGAELRDEAGNVFDRVCTSDLFQYRTSFGVYKRRGGR